MRMKLLVCFLFVLSLFSCCRENKNTSYSQKEDNDSVSLFSETQIAQDIDLRFLGHQIQCPNDELPHVFTEICTTDENLSFDSVSQNITLYGTTFHLNYRNDGRGFMLMSSVQPDTRQIRIVRDAISKFHGKENFEEDCHYSWLPFTDSTKIGQNYPVIHLRRVRSEEGGTVIIVN